MRPELMVADPAVVAPGGVVALTFPAKTDRGILFVLEQRVGDSWAHRYSLTSDGPGPGWEQAWYLPDADGISVPDIGVAGGGPDRVPIPEPAELGDYRICTGNAADNLLHTDPHRRLIPSSTERRHQTIDVLRDVTSAQLHRSTPKG